MIIYVQHQIQQKEIEIYLKFVKFKNKDRFRLQFLKFKKAVQNLWQHLNLQFISFCFSKEIIFLNSRRKALLNEWNMNIEALGVRVKIKVNIKPEMRKHWMW